MKKNIFKSLVLGLFGLIFISSCVKDSFDTKDIGDAGSTFVSFSEGREFALYMSPFEDVRKVSVFTLVKNANSNANLNKPNVVRIKAAPEVIDMYNEDHEEEYEWISTEIAVSANPAYESTSDGYNVQFAAGDFAQSFSLEMDGSKFDLSKQYAVAFTIEDAGGLNVNAGKDTIFAIIGVKNPYDGIYTYTTSANTSLMPELETEAQLITVGANRVKLYPGLLATYSNEVYYNIDPETFAVTVECPSLGVQEPQDERSNWDPDTRTLTVFWKQGNGGRTFEEVFKFKGER